MSWGETRPPRGEGAPGRAQRASGGLGLGSQPLSTHRLTGEEPAGRAGVAPETGQESPTSLQAGDAAGGLFGLAPVGSPH